VGLRKEAEGYIYIYIYQYMQYEIGMLLGLELRQAIVMKMYYTYTN
jgi:hypothetical protein